jgi:LPS-assembly lipoprotein
LLVGACGFHPLYGQADAPARAELLSIMIGPVVSPDSPRAGQLISNDLDNELAPQGHSGPARFRLSAVVRETDSSLLVNAASQTTRDQVALNVSYSLTDASTNRPLVSGSLRRTLDYDVLRINYGNIVGAADARRRLARQIADEIASRLAVWFSRRQQAPS